MRHRILTILAALVLSACAHAQQPATSPLPAVAKADPAAPTLTTEQKLAVQNAAQQLEILQLRAQAIARDFEAARAALQQLVSAVTPEGYTLNDRLELVKVPEPKKEPDTKK